VLVSHEKKGVSLPPPPPPCLSNDNRHDIFGFSLRPVGQRAGKIPEMNLICVSKRNASTVLRYVRVAIHLINQKEPNKHC
jgi:hypothetical protein